MIPLAVVAYWDWTTSITNAVVAALPDIVITNTPGGYWKGNCNPAAFTSHGIKILSYITGGYEGDEYSGNPTEDALASNIARIDAIALDGSTGVFLDEVSSTLNSARKTYLTAIRNECLAKGLLLAINPGDSSFDTWLFGIADYVMTDEQYAGSAASTTEKTNLAKCIVVGYSSNMTAALADQYSNAAITAGFGHTYHCNDYNDFPSWFATYVSGINGSVNPITPTPAPGNNIGYISSWGIEHISNFLANFKFNQLTHCIYSSVYPTGVSNPTLIVDGANADLTNIIAAAHAAGCKVILSLSDNAAGTALDGIFGNQTYLAQTITNVMSYINSYGFDGVSLDWEQSTWASDHQTKVLNFLSAMRTALGTKILMLYSYQTARTDCTSAGDQYCDFIDLGYGPGISIQKSQAAFWVAQGFTKGKIIIDLPFYGTDSNGNVLCSWADIVNNINPLPTVDSLSISSVVSTIKTSPQAVPGGVLIWDSISDVQNITSWANTNGYAGVGFWECSWDIENDSRSLTQIMYIALNPASGFIHGTSHTASFQITISPANQPCKIELWLGPNSTTKSATGGLSSAFNSTGAAEQVTSIVTLPNAGVYNVYVDVYLNNVKVQSFVGLSTITVT